MSVRLHSTHADIVSKLLKLRSRGVLHRTATWS